METAMFPRSSSTCTEEDVKAWKIGCSAAVSVPSDPHLSYNCCNLKGERPNDAPKDANIHRFQIRNVCLNHSVLSVFWYSKLFTLYFIQFTLLQPEMGQKPNYITSNEIVSKSQPLVWIISDFELNLTIYSESCTVLEDILGLEDAVYDTMIVSESQRILNNGVEQKMEDCKSNISNFNNPRNKLLHSSMILLSRELKLRNGIEKSYSLRADKRDKDFPPCTNGNKRTTEMRKKGNERISPGGEEHTVLSIRVRLKLNNMVR
ncbi:hypothetical protein WN51_04620 [Melipona quadrifasciata]|uniref:Uncharacterized protein n=1 Tax=Melipona quadrifasciata TaxID=166423 RepID=A0A0N0U473_9HYME|nr:hypothetical protein WN51_04620 [Melipona quadrifasciata]